MKLRVSYAKRRYKDKVYVTPLLVYSYRDEKGVPRNKTVFNLSILPPQAITALEKALRSPSSSLFSLADIQYQFSLPWGNFLAVKHLMRELSIEEALQILPPSSPEMVLMMIVNRVTEAKPLSMRALCDSWSFTPLPLVTGNSHSPKLDYWYDTLSTLYHNQETIETELYEKRRERKEEKRNREEGREREEIKKINEERKEQEENQEGREEEKRQTAEEREREEKRVFLYDITSVYLEGKHCPLASFGYNRDGKKGKKQIVIGLLTDEEGYPLATEVFTGNTNDQTTVGEQIKKLKERFKAERLIFIGDRGMLTSARIEEIESGLLGSGIDFITALKRKDLMELLARQEKVLQLGLFDQPNLAEFQEGNRRYVLCYNPNRKVKDATQREKLLWKTEQKLLQIARCVAGGYLKSKDKILHRLYKWIDRWKMERFFQVEVEEGKFSYRRKEEEIERYRRLDGCYVLVTSLPPEELSKEEVEIKYKSLSQVEQDFRTLKSVDLEIRPVRHWKEEQVRGHVFLCSLALRVTYEARKMLLPLLKREENNHHCEGKSLREIWEDLKRFSIGYLKIGEELIHQIGEPTETQSKILDLLGINPAKRNCSQLLCSK